MLEFLKIIGGVAAFIIGQAILQFVFQPIKDFNKQRGDTSYLLLFHQSKIVNVTKDKKACAEIREMGAALVSTMRQIPFYNFLAQLRVFGLPSKNSVLVAAQELNGIVYSLDSNEQHGNSAVTNSETLQKISQLLKIQTAYR